MKTLGQIRRAVRDIIRRVEELERKIEVLIDVFAKDSFDDAKPPAVPKDE